MLTVNLVFIYPPQGWHRQFVDAIYHGMINYGFKVNLIDLTSRSFQECVDTVRKAPPADLWYVARHSNWMARYLAVEMKKTVVAHVHGGGETKCFRDVVTPQRTPNIDRVLMRHLAAVTVNTQHHYKLLRELYREDCPFVFVSGFPIELSKYKKYLHHRKEIILVPARYIPSKQPILLAKALEAWKHIVVFCSPEKYTEGVVEKDVCHYLNTIGYTALNDVSHEAFIELLAQAKVVVSASMADTLNVSMIEGSLCGANVVAPDTGPFNEYLDKTFLYEPFSIRAIRDAISSAWISPYKEVDGLNVFDWRVVSHKIADFLKYVVKRRENASKFSVPTVGARLESDVYNGRSPGFKAK